MFYLSVRWNRRVVSIHTHITSCRQEGVDSAALVKLATLRAAHVYHQARAPHYSLEAFCASIFGVLLVEAIFKISVAEGTFAAQVLQSSVVGAGMVTHEFKAGMRFL